MATPPSRKGIPNPNAGRKPKADEQELIGLLNEAWPREKRLQTIEMLGHRASAGDAGAASLLLAYAYGKPKQAVDLTNDHQGGITVTVVRKAAPPVRDRDRTDGAAPGADAPPR